jgi:hypothetical protein
MHRMQKLKKKSYHVRESRTLHIVTTAMHRFHITRLPTIRLWLLDSKVASSSISLESEL